MEPEIQQELFPEPLPEIEGLVDSFPMVCGVCKEANLSSPIHLLECPVCSSTYCVHFASTIDPAHCTNCLRDVEMTEQIIYKKSEHYNEEKDKVYVKTSKARQIQFGGLDWLFFNRRITNLTDTELLLSLEYHQAIYHHMMYEREKRRADYAHRNAGKHVTIKKSDGNAITSIEKTTVRKTRTIKATGTAKAAANVAAILEQLIKQGMSPEQILQVMGVKK